MMEPKYARLRERGQAIRALVRRLRGAAHIETPERRLCFAVVALSVEDLLGVNPNGGAEVIDEARGFLRTSAFDRFCAYVDLNPEWVREQISKWDSALNQQQALAA